MNDMTQSVIPSFRRWPRVEEKTIKYKYDIMKTLGNILAAMTTVAAISCTSQSGWSNAEKSLIMNGGATMRVLTVNDASDSLTLRKSCGRINENELKSIEYQTLAEKMVATVTSPEQDGVGIAGPQVGISRRIVAVQRFDKSGAPFEVYPNILVAASRGEKVPGSEGCLSIPGRSGKVARYRDIDITYTSTKTLRDTTETIQGFTAVIFQHECDHLDGILYTDYF